MSEKLEIRIKQHIESMDVFDLHQAIEGIKDDFHQHGGKIEYINYHGPGHGPGDCELQVVISDET